MIDHGTHVRRRLAAAAVCGLLLTGAAQASTIDKTTNGWLANVLSNAARMTGPTSSPTWSTTPGATPYSSGNIGFGSDGTLVWGQGASKMPLPAGRSADILIKQPIEKAAAARAIARTAMRFAGAAGTALWLYDLWQAYGVDTDATGTPQVPGSPMVYYRMSSSVGVTHPKSSSVAGACGAVAAELSAVGAASGGTYQFKSLISTANMTCTFDYYFNKSETNAGGPFTGSRSVAEVAVDPADPVTQPRPMTEDELANKIASESGWPQAATKALAESIKAGESVQTSGAPQVSGPGTIEGPKTTTQTQTPTGTQTTTSQTTYNITYQGDTITINQTTTNITTHPDGTTTTETQTSEEKPEEEKCPDGSTSLSCATLDEPDKTDIPKDTKTLTYSPENIGLGGGSCPAPITKTLGGRQVTVFDYAPGCNILSTYVRPLILALSAFIAFMILIPGGRTE